MAPAAVGGAATGVACACPSAPAVTSVAEKAPTGTEVGPSLASGPSATPMKVDLSSMGKDDIDKFAGSGCWEKFFGSKNIKSATTYGNKQEGAIAFFANDNSDLKACLIVNVDISDSSNKQVRFELTLEDNGRYGLALWGYNNISTKESTGFVKVIKKNDDDTYEDAGVKQDKFSTTTTMGTELLNTPASLFKEKISWSFDKSSKDGWTWERNCKTGQDRIGIFSSQFSSWSQKLFKKPGTTPPAYWSTLFSGWEDKMGIWTKVAS